MVAGVLLSARPGSGIISYALACPVWPVVHPLTHQSSPPGHKHHNADMKIQLFIHLQPEVVIGREIIRYTQSSSILVLFCRFMLNFDSLPCLDIVCMKIFCSSITFLWKSVFIIFSSSTSSNSSQSILQRYYFKI